MTLKKTIQSELRVNPSVWLGGAGFRWPPPRVSAPVCPSGTSPPSVHTVSVSSRGQNASPDDVCPPVDSAAGVYTFLFGRLTL